jgi:hypothetical protein
MQNPALARWHAHLHALVTSIHETSGLKSNQAKTKPLYRNGLGNHPVDSGTDPHNKDMSIEFLYFQPGYFMDCCRSRSCMEYPG